MKRSILSISSILMLTAILILVNGIGSLTLGRFKLDLTEEGLFSLSDGTKNILSGIEDRVTLKFYSSRPKDMHPGLKVYAERIEDLLEEYKRHAGEKLNLEIFYPEPDTDSEDWAKKYGLTPFSLPGKTPIFLGLVGVNDFADEDIIPFFQPDRQSFLEYDITKLIYNLEKIDKPKVGIISSVSLQGSAPTPVQPGQPQPPQQQPWFFLKQLSSLAEVVLLESDIKKINDDISLLMIIHPPEFSEATRYAIDQYVVKGGNLFVAVDPNCQSCAGNFPGIQQQNQVKNISPSSNLNLLLEGWGVNMQNGKIVGNRDLAANVGMGQGQVAEFLLWLAFSKNRGMVSQDSVVTSELDALVLPWAGSLVLKDVQGVKSAPLLETTENSKLYDSSTISTINSNPNLLLKTFESNGEKHVISAILSGKFKSNFKESPKDSDLDFVEQSETEANIVVVADVDFIADSYSVSRQQFFNASLVSLLNDNILFLQNSVENLLGSNNLISLRSRGTFSRPFSRVEEIKRLAEERWRGEEEQLQEELNQINARLNQLMNSQGSKNKAIVNQALLDEIKNFREQQKEARTKLREIRRVSREDIEKMEQKLFFVNTFLVPMVLIFLTILVLKFKRRKRL